jgi:hypothetical protein
MLTFFNVLIPGLTGNTNFPQFVQAGKVNIYLWSISELDRLPVQQWLDLTNSRGEVGSLKVPVHDHWFPAKSSWNGVNLSYPYAFAISRNDVPKVNAITQATFTAVQTTSLHFSSMSSSTTISPPFTTSMSDFTSTVTAVSASATATGAVKTSISSHTTTIVGASIGSIILMFAIGFFLFLNRRRRIMRTAAIAPYVELTDAVHPTKPPLPEPTDIASGPHSTGKNIVVNVSPQSRTARQEQLREREQENVAQIQALECRVGSSEWVSRAELDGAREVIARLIDENQWLRDIQQSDWALGLSEDMPPPYRFSTQAR